MTFQPPPGNQPPPGSQPPPGGPQPQPGQWGPPPTGGPGGPAGGPAGSPGGGFGGGSGGFDAKAFNPLDWGIVGAGVLTFLLSFIDFYDGAEITSGGKSQDFDTDAYSAWHDVIGGGFFSWFAMVFAIAGAAAVAVSLFAPHIKLPVPARLAGLGLFALAAVFEIIGIFVTPGDSGSYGLGGGDIDVSLNHGFGFWASLIVIIAGLALSLMRFQATGGQLPGGLQSKVPNVGGYGPQGGISGGSPQPGYGQAPPPPGYGGQQAPPPPGYGQQPPPPPGYGPPQ